MVPFWIIAALLAAGALWFVVRPLLGAGDTSFNREVSRIRAQLQTLEQAHADGHVAEQTYTERRAALKDALEQLISAPRSEGRATTSATALALLIPAAAVMIYLAVGNPDGISVSGTPGPNSLAARGGAAPPPSGNQSAAAGQSQSQAPELQQAIAGLAARLQQNPDDVEGWFLLGQSYLSTNDFEAAERAFAQAYELAPDNPAVVEMYANAIAFASPPSDGLPAEAKALFEKALELNPESQRSMYFLGAGAFQSGDYEGALGYWEQLYNVLDPAGEAANRLLEDINAARDAIGEAPLPAAVAATPAEVVETPSPTATPTPAPAIAAASEGPGLTVEVELAAALREQVSPNDTLFIFARAAEGPRMPLAIHRLAAGELPVRVRLDESMAMSPAMNLTTFPQVVVEARISKTGDAAPRPGDLQALSDPVANDRAEPVRLVIDQVL